MSFLTTVGFWRDKALGNSNRKIPTAINLPLNTRVLVKHHDIIELGVHKGAGIDGKYLIRLDKDGSYHTFERVNLVE